MSYTAIMMMITKYQVVMWSGEKKMHFNRTLLGWLKKKKKKKQRIKHRNHSDALEEEEEQS